LPWQSSAATELAFLMALPWPSPMIETPRTPSRGAVAGIVEAVLELGVAGFWTSRSPSCLNGGIDRFAQRPSTLALDV
jgi:hypothetical protein